MSERPKKILFLLPYSAVPPRYGGPLRVHNLCLQLSRHYQVVAFAQQAQRSAINGGLSPIIQQVTPTYTEHSSRNPLSVLLFALTSLKWHCPPVWQSALLRVSAARWLREQLRQADIVHVEQPWQFAWVHRLLGGAKPIVLGTQNVESALYTVERIGAPRWLARRLLGAIQSQEAFAVRHATHILAVTAQERDLLAQQHGVPAERFSIVPNGVDCARFTPASHEQRQQRKLELGLAGKQVVLFAGSMHHPNVEAVEQIVEWATRWPDEDTCFLIVGTIGRLFAHVQHARLHFTGSVQETRPYFEAADLAINPMKTGSGSNLKQLEFMAMGLPTIASPVGARGIPIVDGVHGLIRPLEHFPEQIRQLLADGVLRPQLGRGGRDFVAQRFDWSVVVEPMLAAYQALLDELGEPEAPFSPAWERGRGEGQSLV
jgi:glycosyltransferase involved in cell wall biosynthesis